MGYTAQVAQTTQDPSYLKLHKWEQNIRKYGDSIGYDPNLMFTEKEFSDVQQQAAQQNQVMQQQAQQAQGAEIAKTLSEAKTGQGSMLDNMLAASGI